MEARLENGKIALRFRYSEKTIEQIKGINGRQWISLMKKWEIPFIDDNIKFIERIGFDTTQLKKDIAEKKNEKEQHFCCLEKELKLLYPFLYEHQVECTAKALVSKRLLIADETGIGKTAEALATADYLLKNGRIDKIVVLCPKSIMKQWRKEAKKFFSLDFRILLGMPKNKRLAMYKKFPHLIMTYDTAAIDLKELYPILNGNTILIMDEMTKVKNEKTRRAKSIRMFKPQYMLGLTGTPIETKLMNGFVIGTTLFPDWMNKNEFYNAYCVMEYNGYGNVLIGYKNISGFMQRLMEISIARKKKDVRADMPDKTYYIRNVDLTLQQKKLSQNIMTIIRKKHDGTREIYLEDCVLLHMCGNSTSLIKDSNALALRKMNKDDIKRESGKIKELVELLKEIGDKKIVIFAHYLGMIKEIKDALKDTVMSATSENVIEQIEKFETNDKRVLLLTDACAYGVDIPFATALIHFDIQWNPAKMKQREERIYRITSKHDISVYYFVAGGVEEYMFDYMNSKKEIGEQVTGMDIKKQLQKFLYR